MPLAKPRGNEKKTTFITRCMADSVMTRDFKDSGQRRAVCESQWTGRTKKGERMDQVIIAKADLAEWLRTTQGEGDWESLIAEGGATELTEEQAAGLAELGQIVEKLQGEVIEDRLADAEGLERIEYQVETVEKRELDRYLLGAVLKPEEEDAHKDIYSAREVELAAWRFMAHSLQAKEMHTKKLTKRDIVFVESYLTREEVEFGGKVYPVGTWFLGAILSKTLWEKVESGELTGWSIGALVTKTPEG